MQIKDHVFLVTGGASGLGAAVARLIAEKAAPWSSPTSNRAAGEALAEELGRCCRASRSPT